MVKFEVPGRDAPGYLRRMRKFSEFMEMEDGAARWDAMTEYLLDYVVEPKDRDKAREALWDMSEAEYEDMLSQLNDQGEVSKNT
jgi:hypothetical protein